MAFGIWPSSYHQRVDRSLRIRETGELFPDIADTLRNVSGNTNNLTLAVDELRVEVDELRLYTEGSFVVVSDAITRNTDAIEELQTTVQTLTTNVADLTLQIQALQGMVDDLMLFRTFAQGFIEYCSDTYFPNTNGNIMFLANEIGVILPNPQ
jgi:hypothetical protein